MRKGGVIQTRLKMSDYTGAFRSGSEKLPSAFTLPKDRIPDVRDQGAVNSCVGFATTNIMQIFNQIETGKRDRFSPGYVYGRCRDDADTYEGMQIPKTLDYLRRTGACMEKDFPVNEEMPEIRSLVKAHPELDEMAEPYHIEGYEIYAFALKEKKYQSVKEAIYRFRVPVLGVIEMPRMNHAVCVIGWDDKTKTFQILNSWGEEWGEKGIGSVPYYQLERGYLLMDAKNTNIMPFEDVKEGAWYYDAVKKVYNAGLMNGCSETAFEPERAMTRAEVAQVLVNFMKKVDDVLKSGGKQ